MFQANMWVYFKEYGDTEQSAARLYEKLVESVGTFVTLLLEIIKAKLV
jgi:hypothetical protein